VAVTKPAPALVVTNASVLAGSQVPVSTSTSPTGSVRVSPSVTVEIVGIASWGVEDTTGVGVAVGVGLGLGVGVAVGAGVAVASGLGVAKAPGPTTVT